MKPRTTLIVAAALFAATAVIAIVLVSTSGGEKPRHLRESSEAQLDSLDDPILRDQRRAAAARPEVTIMMHADRFTVITTGLASPVFDEISTDLPAADSTAKLRETLKKVHDAAGDDVSVTFEPDPDVVHGAVVDAMETAKAAGFERLSIHTP